MKKTGPNFFLVFKKICGQSSKIVVTYKGIGNSLIQVVYILV